jgi:hypothetical protein
MGQDQQLRGHLIAMLVGAVLLVLAQFGAWPPDAGLERAVTGFTVAAAVIAVSLTVYEWRQGRPRRNLGDRPRPLASSSRWCWWGCTRVLRAWSWSG